VSSNALSFRLAFVVCGPPMGAMVDAIGPEAALGLLGAGVAALAAFARAHARRESGAS
jgi:hypothetical protein